MNMESQLPLISQQSETDVASVIGAPVSEQSARTAQMLLLHTAFVVLFVLLSPIYFLNRWDFKRKTRRNPFYASKLVVLQERWPILYELAMFAQNFPVSSHVYKALPPLNGDVLQVGCGTGLLNKFLQNRKDLRLVNMDPNPRALALGCRLKRYTTFVHAFIDKPTDLPDHSFDTILFARSFHHVRNHKRAFKECARLVRPGGHIIVMDPVMLSPPRGAPPASGGYMANSSIDGMIWRFTAESLMQHLQACLPPGLTLRSIRCIRQPHVTNYNLFVPQTDALAIIAAT